MTIYRHVH